MVKQDFPRIGRAVADGSLATNAALGDFIGKLKASGGMCHLCGLVSPGGVHSHQDHQAYSASSATRRSRKAVPWRGWAVVYLIRSMAKREVTFLSGAMAIRRL